MMEGYELILTAFIDHRRDTQFPWIVILAYFGGIRFALGVFLKGAGFDHCLLCRYVSNGISSYLNA